MKMTVGPLSPGVYWRRRAVVVGGVLALLLVTTYTCSAQSDAGSKKKGVSAQGTPTKAASPTGQPTQPIVLTPSPGEATSGAPPIGNPGGGRGGTGPCQDIEITVTPAVEPSPVKYGMPATLYLRVRNISNRTCVRDVGAEAQEIFIQLPDRTLVWSSDKCAPRTGDSVVSFAPDHEEQFSAPWDGKATNQGCDARPQLQRGSYRLYARVGTKVSEPVVLTIA